MLIESVELWEQHYGEIIFLLFDLAKEDMVRRRDLHDMTRKYIQ